MRNTMLNVFHCLQLGLMLSAILAAANLYVAFGSRHSLYRLSFGNVIS